MARLLLHHIPPIFVRTKQPTTQPATIPTSVSTEELSPTATQHLAASMVASIQTAARHRVASMVVPIQIATLQPHNVRVLLPASQIPWNTLSTETRLTSEARGSGSH